MAGAAATVDAFRVARGPEPVEVRTRAGLAALGAGTVVASPFDSADAVDSLKAFAAFASTAGFRRTGRALGSMFELSVFRVVFAMSSVLPFLKRAAAPRPRAVSCSGEVLSEPQVYHAARNWSVSRR
jgi:hypothetical protein